MSDSDEQRLTTERNNLAPIVSPLHMDDSWHRKILDDVFASELVFEMTNNIAFYVSNQLLPFRVHFRRAEARRDRNSLDDISAYVARFSSSSAILMHLLITELEQLRQKCMLDVRPMFVLNVNSEPTTLSLDDLLQGWRALADGASPPRALGAVVTGVLNEAFIELFYVLRTPRVRFSVAASSDHTRCITTLAFTPPPHLPRLCARAGRMDAEGRLRPSVPEYFSIIGTVLLSLALGVTAGVLNWAGRDNVLERLFDGVGVFSLSSALTVAIASRRLDLYDLIFLLFGKSRFLTGYVEMLSVLLVNDRELKVALTYPGVCVPPLAGSSTCYAYERHDGLFDTIQGLSSEDKDANVIIGSMAAVMRAKEGGMRHFRIEQRQLVHHMVPDKDAQFRIVVPGDHIFVK